MVHGAPACRCRSISRGACGTPRTTRCCCAPLVSSTPGPPVWFPAPPAVAGLGSVLSHAKLGIRSSDGSARPTGGADRRNTVLPAPRCSRADSTESRFRGPSTRLRTMRPGSPGGWRRQRRPERPPRSSQVRARRFGSAAPHTSTRSTSRELLPTQRRALQCGARGGGPGVRRIGCREYYIAEAGGAVGIPLRTPHRARRSPRARWTASRWCSGSERSPTRRPWAAVLTVLDPLSPKLLINLESDDMASSASAGAAACWTELGLSLHLHSIRGRRS